MFEKKNINNLLFLFLLFHLFIWTLVPTFSNLNLPLDTIEHLAWASNLDWGYNKHPPLVAFILNIFFEIFGNQDWTYYLLSQIFIILSFLIIYKFTEDFLNSKKLALLSILLLEGIIFYNFTSPEFNVNVCQLPFWAMSVHLTWRCIKFNKTSDYIYLGLIVGLGILSKYLFIYLVIGIKLLFLYLLSKKKKFKFQNLFIAGFFTSIVLLPHLIWLTENNFMTISYGLQRAGSNDTFLDHLIFPSIFLLKQIGLLIPLFIMMLFLLRKIELNFNFKDERLIFLIFTTLVPLLLILLTSIIMGVKIRTMWMTPFYLFFGVLLLYVFKKDIKINKLKNFTFIFVFFLILSPAVYLGISLSNDMKRTDYPGKEIARLVQNKWDQNFINEIKVVIGDEWFAGNLSYHLNSRPKWMLNLDNDTDKIGINEGVVYTGNPKVLKEICPGVFGTINPVGYCMIGQK
tara:strand:- start:4052 stop:5425 length:1374 start_codon:yes stop_codon:yes gene_type:complete